MVDSSNFRGDSSKIKKPRKAPKQLSGMLVNIADSLPEADLAAIAEICVEDFEADRSSRAEWDSMHADWVAVYNQCDAPINPPWQNSSDESIGLLTESCNSFQARAYKAFFPSRNPITALAVGKQSPTMSERAKRVGKYLQWSLFTRDQTYKEEKSAMLLRVAIHGSDFSKTYFDPVMNKIVVRPVRAQDLYVPYSAGPVNIEDVPRKTELIHLGLNEGRWRAKAGYFSVVPVPMAQGINAQPQQQQADSDGGVKPGSLSDSEDYSEIVEQHRDLDLDGDGIAAPYKVWVDVTARVTLRIEVRYDVDDLGRPTNGKLPIEEYTHYRFLVNPDGFYGYGLGFLIGKTNIAMNKMLRQYIDATTLAIHGNMSGFISDELNVSKGPVKLELGSFKTVSASAEQIQKGIKTMDFKPPSDGLMKAMGQLENRAQRIGAATDALSGDIQKVMQPTTIMTMVEQGLMLFTSVQEFLLNSWSKELNKVYRLNSLYFRGEEWFVAISPAGAEEAFVKEEDFRDDMMIMPVADPRMSSQQTRIQRAQFLYDFALKNPLIASRPEVLLKVTRRLLEEMDFDSIDELLPKDVKELPPSQPDPKVQAIQAKAQAEQAKMAGQQQNEQQKIGLLAQKTKVESDAIVQKSQVDAQVAMTKMGINEEMARQNAGLKSAKMSSDIEMSRAKTAHERDARTSELAGNHALSRAESRAAIRLDREKARADVFTKAMSGGAPKK